MAAINHTVTEQELKDIRYALIALENKLHPYNPAYADEGSRLITIGVFRGLFTPDGVERWIAKTAERCFVVPQEKGRGYGG